MANALTLPKAGMNPIPGATSSSSRVLVTGWTSPTVSSPRHSLSVRSSTEPLMVATLGASGERSRVAPMAGRYGPLDDRGGAAVAVRLALSALVAGRWGYHRDEPYYLACAARPAWGYVDHPPGVPALAGASARWLGTAPAAYGWCRRSPPARWSWWRR